MLPIAVIVGAVLLAVLWKKGKDASNFLDDPPVSADDWTPGDPPDEDVVEESRSAGGIDAGTTTSENTDPIERSISPAGNTILAGGDAAKLTRGESALAYEPGRPTIGSLVSFCYQLPPLYEPDPAGGDPGSVAIKANDAPVSAAVFASKPRVTSPPAATTPAIKPSTTIAPKVDDSGATGAASQGIDPPPPGGGAPPPPPPSLEATVPTAFSFYNPVSNVWG